MAIRIDHDKCTRCGTCVASCPFALLEIVGDRLQVKDGCTLCGACRDACACEAIVIEAAVPAATADAGYRGVWVFAEPKDGQWHSVTYELLAKGRQLADELKTELCAVCIGNNISNVAESLFASGADKVYLLDSPALATFPEDVYARRLADMVKQYKPAVVLAGATPRGRAFIPRVAAVLGAGLTADCTGLEIESGTGLLLQTRPTFGGNLMATIVCPSRRPQMATVRPRVFKRNSPVARQGQLIKVDFNVEQVTSRTKVLSFVADLAERVNLEDADIIVAGGRGLGKPENFALLKELAKALGAALGSSRPPVDEGWLPYAHQVGQTGKTVCPKLYIACGISGAVQHLAGMQTADVIVAINDDPRAPIFEVATYGIIGDLFKVVPLLIEKLGKE